MKLIKAENQDVFTSDSRERDIEIPVFSFSGVTIPSLSPPWSPSSPIRLTRWQISAGTPGTNAVPSASPGNYTHFQILVGDNNLVRDGNVVANGALDGAGTAPFYGGTVPVPRQRSYKSIYNLNGDKGRDTADVLYGILPFENILVSNRQWIKVKCLVSCGHADVTVNIYGVYVNIAPDSGGFQAFL
jgi:hypothetical protein